MALHLQIYHAYAKPDLSIEGFLYAYPEDRDVPFQAASLRLCLTGTSRTRIRGPDGKIFEKCITFLEISKEVYPGIVSLGWGDGAPCSLYLPDDPAAPLQTEEELKWVHRKKLPPQALPPSGEFGEGNIITYEAQVRMLDQSQIIREVKSNILEVKFTQTRVEEDVHHALTRLVQTQKFNILDDDEGSPTFDIMLDIPQTVVQGGGIPLLLRLSSNVSGDCLLAYCHLTLIQDTLVTCQDQNKHDFKHISLGSSVADFPGLAFPATGLDLSRILEHPTISASQVPSFSSGNIQRMYRFDVSVGLLKGNKAYPLLFNLDPLLLLPAETSDKARAQHKKELSAIGDDGYV